MVSSLTTHIFRLEATELTSDGAFESCTLTEHSNNISSRRCRIGAASPLVEDDHIKLTMSIKGISVPTNSDAVILDLYMGSLDTWLLVSDTCQVITPTDQKIINDKNFGTLIMHQPNIFPFRLPHMGLPNPKNPSVRGDLIVEFDIQYPSTLTSVQKDLVRNALS